MRICLDYADDIVRAIIDCYSDNEDMMAHCLAQLANTDDSSLCSLAECKLQEMKRCNRCGEKLLETLTYEYHDEVDAFEEFVDIYCPCCDLGWEES